MKIHQFTKSIAAITVLGIALTGCSGGSEDARPSTQTATPTPKLTSPVLSNASAPQVSGGAGQVGYGASEADDALNKKLDDMIAAQKTANDGLSGKLDAQAKTLEDVSSDTNLTKWLSIGAVAGVGALVLAKVASMVNNGLKASNKTGDAMDGVKAGFLDDYTPSLDPEKVKKHSDNLEAKKQEEEVRKLAQEAAEKYVKDHLMAKQTAGGTDSSAAPRADSTSSAPATGPNECLTCGRVHVTN